MSAKIERIVGSYEVYLNGVKVKESRPKMKYKIFAVLSIALLGSIYYELSEVGACVIMLFIFTINLKNDESTKVNPRRRAR